MTELLYCVSEVTENDVILLFSYVPDLSQSQNGRELIRFDHF